MLIILITNNKDTPYLVLPSFRDKSVVLLTHKYAFIYDALHSDTTEVYY
jgi:hypothetical protein